MNLGSEVVNTQLWWCQFPAPPSHHPADGLLSFWLCQPIIRNVNYPSSVDYYCVILSGTNVSYALYADQTDSWQHSSCRHGNCVSKTQRVSFEMAKCHAQVIVRPNSKVWFTCEDGMFFGMWTAQQVCWKLNPGHILFCNKVLNFWIQD